ncbi:MAG: hypothetical protein EBQ92_04530 [Proteobacteria bacterium]|nr:hypothetical protein [Pseudomonadota bacterium]
MVPPHFSKYLSTYAEPESRELSSTLLTEISADFGVALPLRGESPLEVNERLLSLEALVARENKQLLVVAVINGGSDSETEYNKTNLELVSFLNSDSSEWNDCFLLQRRSHHLTVLWVDRAIRSPFQNKQGVGLARKIGCDLLCRLRAEKKLRSPWLFTTDADATLPADYFEMPDSPANAFHFPYRHDLTGFEGSQALLLYEIHLRYYFLGIHWARSPYAYPTIGSCLTIRDNSYVQVRGFQDRQAGEDFHLLNKLRKLGPVEYRNSEPITLRGRFSRRVPFGTGQSTIEIHDQLSSQLPFTLYAPESFSFLKAFLSEITESLSRDLDSGRKQIENYIRFLSASQAQALTCLKELKVPEIIDSAFLTRATPQQRLRHFHTAFDALKTLRLIHLLEERCFPRMVWTQALSKAQFCDNLRLNAPEEALNKLQCLEERMLGSRFVEERYF